MTKTILLVDDDPDIHMLLAAHLQQAGYQTSSAYDGLSCLAVARREAPDLIILDIGLPAGDGEETLRKMCGISQLAEIPVLVVSGRDEGSWGERMKAQGASGYIEKPVDPERLVAEVREILGDLTPSVLPGPTPSVLPGPNAAHAIESLPLSCPHCGGEVGTLQASTVAALLDRAQRPA